MDTVELLRRQIEELQVPPLPTPEEQAQIMKGRGKSGSAKERQADLDAGRQAIADKMQANRDAIKQRSELTTQLSDLEGKGKRQAQEDYAASPEAMRNKALMTLGPSALGWGAGLGGGLLEKGAQGRAEEARNVQRRAIADSGGPLATRMDAAERSGLIPYASKTARGLGRFAPFGAGAAFFGADAGIAHALQQNAGTQGEKDIYGVARNLFGGMAAGSAHAGVSSVFNPKVSPDADALNRIMTPDAAPAPIAPPASPVPPAASSFKTGAEARRYAAERGVPLPSKLTAAEAMSRAEQLKAAAEVAQEGSRAGKLIGKAGKLGIPLAAGALAYDAASGDAEAAGASPTEAKTRGAVAGTATGAAAGGSAYGLSKILEKVPTLGKALGIGGGMTVPLMAMDMGPETDLEHQKQRSAIAQNYPRLAKLLGIEDEMSRLPERNTGKADEFANARALQVPEGIPMPRPDGQLPPELAAAMGAGPQLPQQQPPMPMRRPQLPYAALGFGGRY